MNINKYWLLHAACYVVVTIVIYHLLQWSPRFFPSHEYWGTWSFFEAAILLFIGMILPTFLVNKQFFNDYGRKINSSEEKTVASRTVSALFVISFALVLIIERFNTTPLRGGGFGLPNLPLFGIVIIALLIISTAAYFSIRAIYRREGTNEGLIKSANLAGKYALAKKSANLVGKYALTALPAVITLLSVKPTLNFYIYVRRILVISLILFIVIFSIPIIGAIATNQMVEFFGCKIGGFNPDGFDPLTFCPEGTGFLGLGGRFSSMSLSGLGILILSMIFQPVLLVLAFWDILIAWVLVIIILSIIIFKMRKKAYTANLENKTGG